MSKKKLSVAVIGAGMAGRTHADAWRQASTVFAPGRIPQVHLAAICDVNKAFAESAAASYGYAKAVTNWQEIVQDPSIDMVSIVVANQFHREIAEALIRAGKHVLCEKPLAGNLADAAAMAELAKQAGVVTGIGFTYRRNPAIAQIAKMTQGGDLGTIVHFNGHYWCDYGVDAGVPIAWRYKGPKGSGAYGDLGSHLADAAELICGPIQSVSGAIFSIVHRRRPPASEGIAGGRGVTTSQAATEVVENDDIAVCNVQFANGAVGSLSVSRVAFGLPNEMLLEVMGTKGRAAFNMLRSGEILVDDAQVPTAIRGPRTVLINSDFPYFKGGSAMDFPGTGFTQPDQFIYQARAFIDQVLGIDEGLPPVPGFSHGYRAMRIQDAIARSAAADGAKVEVN